MKYQNYDYIIFIYYFTFYSYIDMFLARNSHKNFLSKKFLFLKFIYGKNGIELNPSHDSIITSRIQKCSNNNHNNKPI